jgi:N-acetylglucosaminyldiphosphoundecaprenol N-acetyl-beta-D-mannosaminyltransferase
MTWDRVDFLGCPVDCVTLEGAIGCMETFIREGVPKHIAVINANKLWFMEKDARLARIVQEASLCVPEKAVVMGIAAMRLGAAHHVGGIMLLKAFLPRAVEKAYRLYLLGAKPSILERVVSVLRDAYPGIQIVGSHHGYLAPGEDKLLAEEIRKLRPHALFVAMGTPRQELWIAEHIGQLGVPVCMGVGGSFDVLAGIKKDAPDWVRAMAMEWLYRLIQDPKNLWRRYLITIPWFLGEVLRARVRKSFPGLGYGQG